MNAATDTIIDLAGTAVLVASTVSTGSSTWSPEQDVDCPTCQNTTADPTETTTYTVTATTMQGCISTAEITIIVDLCNGINDNLNNLTANVYPNPTASNWTVESSGIINSVKLFNLLGQKVLEQTSNDTKVNIDASNLETGVYMLQINNTTMKRLIKK